MKLRIEVELLTALIDIIFALLHLRLKKPIEDTCLLWDRPITFGQDSNLMPGYFELSYCFPNDLFIHTARINVSGIPG